MSSLDHPPSFNYLSARQIVRRRDDETKSPKRKDPLTSEHMPFTAPFHLGKVTKVKIADFQDRSLSMMTWLAIRKKERAPNASTCCYRTISRGSKTLLSPFKLDNKSVSFIIGLCDSYLAAFDTDGKG